eukprot:1288815-Prymnesium_polylepis.1
MRRRFRFRERPHRHNRHVRCGLCWGQRRQQRQIPRHEQEATELIVAPTAVRRLRRARDADQEALHP